MTVCVCLSVVSHTTGGLSRRCLNTIATIFVIFLIFAQKLLHLWVWYVKVWRPSAVKGLAWLWLWRVITGLDSRIEYPGLVSGM